MRAEISPVSRRRFLAGAGAAGLGLAAGSLIPVRRAGRASAAPRTVPDPSAWLITRWEQDPFARGSYSYLSKNAKPKHRRDLAAPIDGRLLFAGEAVNSDYSATVHGAILSGQAAAAEVQEATTTGDRVVVVGAGVAGLAAAKSLQESNRDVVIVEARGRIGGRVNGSERLGPNLDLGASWVHGVRNNPITALARGLGIETVKTDYDDAALYDRDGSPLSWARLLPIERLIHDVLENPEKVALKPRLDEIRRTLDGSEVRWFDYTVASTIEHEFAEESKKLSDYAYYEGEAFGGGDAIHVDGYRWLPELLAEGLDIRLAEPVEEVDYRTTNMRVRTTGGVHTGAVAIVTVPLGVLKAGGITFLPDLPGRHRRAIRKLGMGTLNKLYLRFEEAFWDTDRHLFGYVGRRDRWVEWYDMTRVVGEPILLGFNAGNAARRMEDLADEDIVASAMATLRTIYG